MQRKAGLVCVVVLAVAAAAVLTWWTFGHRRTGPPESPPGETTVAADQPPAAPTPPARAEAREAAGPDGEDAAVPDVLELIDRGAAAAPRGGQTRLRRIDPEIKALIARVHESLGWGKVITMKCTWEMKAGDSGSMRAQLAMETPAKVGAVVEQKSKDESQTYYSVTDGSFYQAGDMGAGGERKPRGAIKEFDPDEPVTVAPHSFLIRNADWLYRNQLTRKRCQNESPRPD